MVEIWIIINLMFNIILVFFFFFNKKILFYRIFFRLGLTIGPPVSPLNVSDSQWILCHTILTRISKQG